MHRRLLTLVGLAILVAGCIPQRGAPERPEPRVVPCRRARGPIAVDGKLDEAAWKSAHTIEHFVLPVSHEKPKQPTSARLLWDDDTLYLGVVMADADVYAMKKEHDSFTWEDDVCELFLKPSGLEHPYYEIHVNPLGTTLDLGFGRRGAGTIDRWTPWESGLKAVVHVSGSLNNWHDTDSGWVVEAAIPLKAFTATTPKPQLGDRWFFAVCRYNYSVYIKDGLELSSSARLTTGNYHQFEDYDLLEFVE